MKKKRRIYELIKLVELLIKNLFLPVKTTKSL